MLAAIALAASGIALAVSGLCAWLTWTQAIAAQRLAREAARQSEDAGQIRETAARQADEVARMRQAAAHQAEVAARQAEEVARMRDAAARQAEDIARMRDAAARMADAQAADAPDDAPVHREAIVVGESSARSAEQSARAAEISARAAEESARATRMLAEAGQRAYVSVGSMQVLRSDLAAGFPTSVRCEIRNTGKTPALSVVSCQWLRPLSELPSDPEYTGIDTISPIDLGPGSMQTSDAAIDAFDPSVSQSLRSRELTMYLFGVSRYTDIFGLTRQTRWAFYWNYEKRQLLRCEYHNDMN